MSGPDRSISIRITTTAAVVVIIVATAVISIVRSGSMPIAIIIDRESECDRWWSILQ